MANWSKHLIGAPAGVRSWLTDRASLTQRLRRRCADFGVQGVRQQVGHPFADEARITGVSAQRTAWVREVILTCASLPQVYAHSVLPHASLVGVWKRLAFLGSSPLGASLFADVRVRRASLQYCRLGARHPLYQMAVARLDQPPEFLWARRSQFWRGRRWIVVTEVFMPAMFNQTRGGNRS
jgi:chorismate--pyruvate lyase